MDKSAELIELLNELHDAWVLPSMTVIHRETNFYIHGYIMISVFEENDKILFKKYAAGQYEEMDPDSARKTCDMLYQIRDLYRKWLTESVEYFNNHVQPCVLPPQLIQWHVGIRRNRLIAYSYDLDRRIDIEPDFVLFCLSCESICDGSHETKMRKIKVPLTRNGTDVATYMRLKPNPTRALLDILIAGGARPLLS